MIENENYLTQEEFKLLDPEFIDKAIKSHEPITVTSYKLTPEMEHYLHNVLSLFLHQLDQDYMTEYLVYCLNELLDNSRRANAKRIYFKENKLDIFSPHDYAQGIKTFKSAYNSQLQYYRAIQEEYGFFVSMTLKQDTDFFYFEVKNNAPLTVFEYKRMHDKIARSFILKNIENAVASPDETESTGLGLTIIIMMLEKIGVNVSNFTILTDDNSTTLQIRIPSTMSEQQYIAAISEELSATLKDLPRLPENVIQISNLLNDPASDINKIIALIKQDIGLTTDLLRMVNSAAIRLSKPCTDIAEAVKMVGIREVSNLIYAVSTVRALNIPKNKVELWRHATTVGYYTLVLAYEFYPSARNFVSDAYTCGILHDIGKVVFTAAHPDTVKNLTPLCTQRSIPPRLLEKITAGANHSEIGALITRNWNFPEVISCAIQYHHIPYSAPKEYRNTVELVYLADLLVHYSPKKYDFEKLYLPILNKYNIKSEEDLQYLAHTIQKKYQNMLKREVSWNSILNGQYN